MDSLKVTIFENVLQELLFGNIRTFSRQSLATLLNTFRLVRRDQRYTIHIKDSELFESDLRHDLHF